MMGKCVRLAYGYDVSNQIFERLKIGDINNEGIFHKINREKRSPKAKQIPRRLWK
jgi:hypothetical protein